MVGPLARTRELEPRATVELGALRRRSGATEANSEKPSGQLFKQTFTFSRKIWESCSTLVIWWFPGGNGTSKLAICDYFRLDNWDFLQAFWTLSAVINKIWELEVTFGRFLYFILYSNPDTILGLNVEFTLSQTAADVIWYDKIWYDNPNINFVIKPIKMETRARK